MKLLVLDVEGTLFRTDVRLPGTSLDSTIWQRIAQALGPKAAEEEVQTHRKWEEGAYKSYLEWMKETILIHRKYGLTRDLFNQLISSAEYNEGVVETLARIDRAKYEPLLVSGGFRGLAKRAQRDLKISHAFTACEYLFAEDGVLDGYNLLPCDFGGKIDFIMLMIREYGLSPDAWLFVGDGANDVPIAKQAPVAVGFRPHRKLREVVTYAIEDFRELGAILERHS